MATTSRKGADFFHDNPTSIFDQKRSTEVFYFHLLSCRPPSNLAPFSSTFAIARSIGHNLWLAAHICRLVSILGLRRITVHNWTGSDCRKAVLLSWPDFSTPFPPYPRLIRPFRMSMTSEDAVAHPEAVLGPRLGTAYFLGLETGIILNLFYRFWKDSSNSSKVIRLVVLFETVFAVLQTALAYYAVYFALVSHFGDWDAVMELRWTGKLQNILNLLLAGIAKAVFIHRCWTVSTRKLYTLLILAVLYFTNEVLGLYFVIHSFRAQTSIAPSDPDAQNSTTSARHIAHQPLYTAQLVLATALNVIIVFILLSTTPRTRFRIQLRYPITSLYRVILLFWEALVFPATFSFIALILYLVLITESFWSDLFQNTIGQLYVFSLFACFASARDRRKRTCASDNMSGGEDVSWRRQSNFDSGEEGFEAAGRSRGSDYELESFEQAPASEQYDDFASRGPLSLSIPERARVRPNHPEGDGPLTPL